MDLQLPVTKRSAIAKLTRNAFLEFFNGLYANIMKSTAMFPSVPIIDAVKAIVR